MGERPCYFCGGDELTTELLPGHKSCVKCGEIGQLEKPCPNCERRDCLWVLVRESGDPAVLAECEFCDFRGIVVTPVVEGNE